jgi:hypothetical protein
VNLDTALRGNIQSASYPAAQLSMRDTLAATLGNSNMAGRGGRQGGRHRQSDGGIQHRAGAALRLIVVPVE